MLALRSLLFAMGQAVSTLVWAPLSILTFPLPFRHRFQFISQWCRFNLWWLKVTCGIRHEVLGRHNIPEGTAIVMSKHQSAWETLALARIFPPQVFVVKRELLWIPLFGWGLAMLRPIAIDRRAGRSAIRQVVEQGKARLDDGCWVIVFPEGTRVAPGKRRRYQKGGAILAEAAGYPVVPVAHNAGEHWRRRAFIKHPGTIRVVIGPALETTGKTSGEILCAVEGWIESTMARITASQFGHAAASAEHPQGAPDKPN